MQETCLDLDKRREAKAIVGEQSLGNFRRRRSRSRCCWADFLGLWWFRYLVRCGDRVWELQGAFEVLRYGTVFRC